MHSPFLLIFDTNSKDNPAANDNSRIFPLSSIHFQYFCNTFCSNNVNLYIDSFLNIPVTSIL